MKRIKLNRIKCKNCGKILTSKSVHDFVSCGCPFGVFADGGKEYLRRGWMSPNKEDKEDCIEELSEYYEENTEWMRT